MINHNFLDVPGSFLCWRSSFPRCKCQLHWLVTCRSSACWRTSPAFQPSTLDIKTWVRCLHMSNSKYGEKHIEPPMKNQNGYSMVCNIMQPATACLWIFQPLVAPARGETHRFDDESLATWHCDGTLLGWWPSSRCTSDWLGQAARDFWSVAMGKSILFCCLQGTYINMVDH